MLSLHERLSMSALAQSYLQTRGSSSNLLTWPSYLPGVTTSPQAIEAVITAVKEFTSRITVGEANGGYHSFRAEEAFQQHGLQELVRRLGLQLINLSKLPVGKYREIVAGREVTVELPRFLVEDIDVFVTIPVPKIHAMTGVSLAFKNQWGCIPTVMRLRNHPQFAYKIIAINRLLKPKLAVFDGRYFLDRNGPMTGIPIEMNLLIVSNDIGAGSYVCCEIMGVDPMSIRHFRLAQQEGMFPQSTVDFVANQPWERFRRHHFHLQRTLLNWIALAAFHSDLATRLLYASPFAGPLHSVLYTIRRNLLIKRLLYGEWGYTEKRRSEGG